MAKKPKAQPERIYAASYDDVWAACVRAATKRFSIEHSDKESGTLTFISGRSARSWGMRLSVALVEKDGKIHVIANPQKRGPQLFAWGEGGRVVKKFFEEMEAQLRAASEPIRMKPGE